MALKTSLSLTIFTSRAANLYAQVVYLQVDEYPASPALLMCDTDEQLNGKLQLLNEHFEEYAVLSDVLRAVCTALNFGAYQGNSLMSLH